jgi:hypothetical protein
VTQDRFIPEPNNNTARPFGAFNPTFGSSMPNETEAMAFALIRLLHEATDGDSMQWRTIRRLDGATDGAVALAAERGWLQRDEFGRVALTGAGREVAQTLGRPLH